MIKSWAERGVRDVGFIGDRYTGERLNNLRHALSDHGIPIHEEYFATTSGRFEECGYRGARELIARGKVPRALLCAYDRIAVGAMRAFGECGIRIPDDVAIFSVDDAPGSAYSTPSLTSASHKVDEVCRALATALMARVKGEEYESDIRFEGELKIRESSEV